MSYVTRVDFEFTDERPEVGEVMNAARAYMESHGRFAVDPVLNDLRRGWEEGMTEFLMMGRSHSGDLDQHI